MQRTQDLERLPLWRHAVALVAGWLGAEFSIAFANRIYMAAVNPLTGLFGGMAIAALLCVLFYRWAKSKNAALVGVGIAWFPIAVALVSAI